MDTPEKLARRWNRDRREQKDLEKYVEEIRRENRTRYAYESTVLEERED